MTYFAVPIAAMQNERKINFLFHCAAVDLRNMCSLKEEPQAKKILVRDLFFAGHI